MSVMLGGNIAYDKNDPGLITCVWTGKSHKYLMGTRPLRASLTVMTYN